MGLLSPKFLCTVVLFIILMHIETKQVHATDVTDEAPEIPENSIVRIFSVIRRYKGTFARFVILFEKIADDLKLYFCLLKGKTVEYVDIGSKYRRWSNTSETLRVLRRPRNGIYKAVIDVFGDNMKRDKLLFVTESGEKDIYTATLLLNYRNYPEEYRYIIHIEEMFWGHEDEIVYNSGEDTFVKLLSPIYGSVISHFNSLLLRNNDWIFDKKFTSHLYFS
ncbi:hypothetical protein PoB_003337800 [Plakobranchus ocellatus]|uniref:NtA domain-containing protein n=1 Tax=Plakobranchus ocellatus TaxID=259542 RepID=A0AAV4AJC7_9GAST|nr:hypothetical protein PoB_003337800 [Plakobranchus ocellatus]